MWPLRQRSFISIIVQALQVWALPSGNPTLCGAGAHGMSSLWHEKQYSPWPPFLKIRLKPSLFLPQVSSASIMRQEWRYLLDQIPIMSMVGSVKLLNCVGQFLSDTDKQFDALAPTTLATTAMSCHSKKWFALWLRKVCLTPVRSPVSSPGDLPSSSPHFSLISP